MLLKKYDLFCGDCKKKIGQFSMTATAKYYDNPNLNFSKLETEYQYIIYPNEEYSKKGGYGIAYRAVYCAICAKHREITRK